MKVCIAQPAYSTDYSRSDAFFEKQLELFAQCDDSMDIIVFPESCDIPCLAKTKEDFEPDYITVAYGTNDWCGRQNVPLFYEQCREFFRILADKYPNSKIFAITPIWRKCEDKKPLGELCEFHSVMENLLKDIPSVIMVRGYDFVPHESKYFADLHLHPNDEGFALQAQGIFEQMKKHI